MMSNLLFYRFIILNILALAIVAALGWSGYLLPLFVTDESRLTIVIAALFLIGWVWSWKEAVTLSMALNNSKRRGPQPACDALRDKAVAKTEWLGSVSEWLVALGLLGTVIGFSMALAGIDQGAVGHFHTFLRQKGMPQIVTLLHERDAQFAAWIAEHPDTEAFEDRDLEVLSQANIDVEEQVKAIRKAIAK